ncbi:hypothetical protein CB1_000552014 [Camelus ferus]|nr:hypothetical protein CB1_000552014 [Camelus ferus]
MTFLMWKSLFVGMVIKKENLLWLRFPPPTFSPMVTRTKKIFVGGLSANTVVEDVKQYFEQFGKIDPRERLGVGRMDTEGRKRGVPYGCPGTVLNLDLHGLMACAQQILVPFSHVDKEGQKIEICEHTAQGTLKTCPPWFALDLGPDYGRLAAAGVSDQQGAPSGPKAGAPDNGPSSAPQIAVAPCIRPQQTCSPLNSTHIDRPSNATVMFIDAATFL